MAHVTQSERTVAAFEYPSSDGKPVAESDFQLTVLTYARKALAHPLPGRARTCTWRPTC